jgi:hypothetical protein
MAVLTATGITFSDATTLSSKYGVLPQSTVAIFYQASAPTGWTQDTAHNDKALRVVNGAGGGFGFGGTSGLGGIAFSSAFPSTAKEIDVPIDVTAPVTGTVGNTTLTTGQIPQHTHNSLTGGNASAAGGGSLFRTPGSTATGGVNEGSGGAHNHPWTGSVTVTTTGNTTLDLRVQYVDVIVCSFN